MVANKIRIVMSDHGFGKIFIDDKEVGGAVSLKFTAEASTGGPNILEITKRIFAREVEIEGPAELVEKNVMFKRHPMWIDAPQWAQSAHKEPDGTWVFRSNHG